MLRYAISYVTHLPHQEYSSDVRHGHSTHPPTSSAFCLHQITGVQAHQLSTFDPAAQFILTTLHFDYRTQTAQGFLPILGDNTQPGSVLFYSTNLCAHLRRFVR